MSETRIHTDEMPEKDRVYTFLKDIEYGCFNLWPKVDKEGIADHIIEEIERTRHAGRVFIATHDGNVMAIVTFKKLEWDTRHFAFVCGRIEHILLDKKVGSSVIGNVLEQILTEFHNYCVQSGIKFVMADVDSWESDISLLLQKFGFRYILTWIDCFIKTDSDLSLLDGSQGTSDYAIEPIRPEEIGYFQKMLRAYFYRGGRFYLDKAFDRQRVDDMYTELIYSTSKEGGTLLVCRIKNKPVGILTANKIISYPDLSSLRTCTLRYLFVDPLFRDRGVAKNLFAEMAGVLRRKGCDMLISGLEVHNIPSLNLHMKLGFRFNYTHNVYHWWNNGMAGRKS